MAAQDQRPAGVLLRTNKLILSRRETVGSSVFTLNHWAAANQAGERDNEAPNASRRRSSGANRRKSLLDGPSGLNNFKLLGIKAQESALDFLFRWMLVDESRRAAEADSERQQLAVQNMGRRKSVVAALADGAGYNKKHGRSSSLLANVSKLPHRSPMSILNFVFRRWLTWANFMELILIIVLIICCIYQCYELLEDYFSYPTHVSVNKRLNDEYLTDLPALTLCNKNRMSKETLRLKHPELNESHFMAMTLGTFFSVNNFTLRRPSDDYYSDKFADYELLDDANQNETTATTTPTATATRPKSKQTTFNASDIDWIKVSRFLSNNTVAQSYTTRPIYDLIDTITCSNVWGDQMPCQSFKRIESIQQGAMCVTLFHDSVLWDPHDPAVQELETALGSSPSSTSRADYDDNIEDVHLLDLNENQLEVSEWAKLQEMDETKVRVDMGNMEMIRLRINFKPEDYANKRSVVGGMLAVHSNSYIATIDHIAYHIEPGFWYSYYLERFDFKRLPPPYKTNCYDYQQNRLDWTKRERHNRLPETKAEIQKLIAKQATRPNELMQEYADNLRARSMGKRECMYMCKAELPATKCNCWPRGVPYVRDNHIDLNNSMVNCNYDTLLKEHSNSSEVAGDDLHFQLCAKEFFLTCVSACPDECNFSSFDVSQQSRSWPSEESRPTNMSSSITDTKDVPEIGSLKVSEDDWEDLLGTGTVLKQVLVDGYRSEQELDMEAPRKFFALIDIETRYKNKLIESESHKNYLISADADLFPGAHLVIPLMDIGEQSRYIFDAKFGYAEFGSPPEIPPQAKLECNITLKLRSQYDEFLNEMSPKERVNLANRKKERGKFWYSRGQYHNAITIYQSLLDLCIFESTPDEGKISEESEE